MSAAPRRHAMLVLLALALSACTTLPGGRAWGDDSTVRPGWQRVAHAAVAAAGSPGFWLPLAGTAVLQLDGWDRKASSWARRRTPVFGSQQNAADWSDRLRAASSYAWVGTVIATPGAADAGSSLIDKTRGAAVDLAAIAVTDGESVLLKHASARARPNGRDRQSLPSSHASRSAVLTELARRNLEWIDTAGGTRRALDAGLVALTLGTSWARVEAGFHYPSDTLVGMAIGNFNGVFFDDAFMDRARSARTAIALEPLRAGARLRLRVAF